MTTMPVKNAQDGEWISLKLTYNSAVETDTGYDIPKGAVIYPWEMFLIIDTIDATETIEVGILSTEAGGDADGFIDAFVLDTAGTYCVQNQVAFTDATNATYYSTNYIGDLFWDGAEGANTSGSTGILHMTPHVGDGTAESIVYTCSAGSDAFVGRLVFRVHQLPL